MLKNISAALSPDLLWCLASMGHGEAVSRVFRTFFQATAALVPPCDMISFRFEKQIERSSPGLTHG